MSRSRTEFLEPLTLGLFFQAAHIFSSGEPCVSPGETLCAKSRDGKKFAEACNVFGAPGEAARSA
jgi:hypothetical protein